MAAVEKTVTFEPADVREWARRDKREIGARGRFSSKLLLDYEAAGSPTYEREAKVSTPRTPAVRTPKTYPVVPLEGDGPHTKRAYAASLGLALNGVRGRLSTEASAAVAKAESEGMVFADPVVVIKPKRISLVHPARVSVADLDAQIDNRPLPEHDAKIVRKWALENNKPVGLRGRLNPALVWEWHDAGGVYVPEDTSSLPAPAESKVVTEARERHSRLSAPPASSEAPERVRVDKTAYVLTKNADEADYMKPVLIGFDKCSKCNHGVPFCGCANGPVPPTYVNAVSDVKFDKHAFDKVSA